MLSVVRFVRVADEPAGVSTSVQLYSSGVKPLGSVEAEPLRFTQVGGAEMPGQSMMASILEVPATVAQKQDGRFGLGRIIRRDDELTIVAIGVRRDVTHDHRKLVSAGNGGVARIRGQQEGTSPCLADLSNRQVGFRCFGS